MSQRNSDVTVQVGEPRPGDVSSTSYADADPEVCAATPDDEACTVRQVLDRVGGK